MSNLTFVHGKNANTSFTINTCGATVTSWRVDGKEYLFLSSKAILDGSKAIRGGIPLCFPQFGPWGEGRPQHGFARNSNSWKVKEDQKNEDGDVTVTMVLSESEPTRKLWDHQFEFLYRITLKSNNLVLNAAISNKGTSEFDLTFCFHTYFRVANVSDVRIKGLKSLTYVDKTQPEKPSVVEQNNDVVIEGFTDRVYKNAPDQIELFLDAAGKEKIILEKECLSDMVVWNPWTENAAKMGDMDNEGYLKMVCVEAAQTSSREIVKPGSEWNATHTITLVKNAQSNL